MGVFGKTEASSLQLQVWVGCRSVFVGGGGPSGLAVARCGQLWHVQPGVKALGSGYTMYSLV